jgi:hypothetical protein
MPIALRPQTSCDRLASSTGRSSEPGSHGAPHTRARRSRPPRTDRDRRSVRACTYSSSHGSRRRTPCRCSTAGGSTISRLALLTRKRSSIAEPTRLPQGCTYGTVTDFGVMGVLTFTDPDSRTVELAHSVGGADLTARDMSRATDDERTDNGRPLRPLVPSTHAWLTTVPSR